MRGLLFPPFASGRGSVGLLVLRIITGSAMLLHGWPKIQNPFSWMGPEAPVPGVLQLCAAVAEFGGGLCWILGLLTPLASLLIACTMLVAAGMVHIPAGDPFVARGGGASYELAAVYLATAIALLCLGPGRLSADYCLFAGDSPERLRPPSDAV